MKKRNYVSILLACVFSCPCVMPSLSVAQTIAYAEEIQADTILPLSIKPDGDYLANTLLVTFKYDYSQEQIESVLFPELADTVGKDRIKEYKLTNVMANDGTVRMTYTVRLNVNHADQYTTYEVASKLHNTGYFHIIETTASDKALPFTETTDGDYYATALVTMFKYDFSKDEIEQVIVPELTELIGTDKVGEFKYIFTDDTSKRNCYNIYLMLDPADKQAAYEIAERLYETGYFYNITMNYVDHPAETTEPPKTTDSPIITSVASGDINCDGKTTVSDAIPPCITLINTGTERLYYDENTGHVYDPGGNLMKSTTESVQTALYEGVKYTVDLDAKQVFAPDGTVSELLTDVLAQYLTYTPVAAHYFTKVDANIMHGEDKAEKLKAYRDAVPLNYEFSDRIEDFQCSISVACNPGRSIVLSYRTDGGETKGLFFEENCVEGYCAQNYLEMGDINLSGSVTVADAVLLARVLAEDSTVKVSELSGRFLDVDSNGKTEADDLTFLLRQLAGIKD